MQDFFTRCIGRQQQRGQRKGSHQRRHQHRGQPLQRAAHDHGLAEDLTLELAQVDVVADLQNPVACGNARQRDEAHHGGHGQAHPRQPHRGHAADERQRNVGHDDPGQHRRLVAYIQNEKDHCQRHQRQADDQLHRLLLGLELAFQTQKGPRWQWRLCHHRTNVCNDAAHVGAVRVGINDDAPTTVFSANLVGAIGFLDRGDGRHRYLPRRRVDQRASQILRTAFVIGQAQHQFIAAQAVHNLRTMGTIRQGLQHPHRLARRQPNLRGLAVVQPYRDLGDQHLLFHGQIHQPWNARESLAHLFGQAPQGVRIVAEDLERDLRPHP